MIYLFVDLFIITSYHAPYCVLSLCTVYFCFAGRYRSSSHLVADVRYLVENEVKKIRPKLQKDSEKTKLAELSSFLITFLEQDFGPKLIV